MSVLGPLLVLALPFAEIATFIVVGQAIGLLPTLALTIGAMALGLLIVKAQGLGHLDRLRRSLRAGEAPVADMLHSLLLAVAGLLFLIPGFLTDILAVLLLLPPVRAAIGLWIWRNMTVISRGGTGSGGPVIEGEFSETAAAEHPEARRLPPQPGATREADRDDA